MTTYDKASLVMIPSGYKDDKLYAVKPTDGSGDFTFSRDGAGASPATRVNASGLIEKGRENEILQSNQFDTTWSYTSGSSTTGGQSGYDGSSDAWLLTDSGTNLAYAVYQPISVSGVYTFSIYAKANSTSQIEIDIFASPTPYLRVELTDGSIHAESNLIDYSVDSVGGGWWRISMTANLSSTSYVRFGANGAGSIYIQDAQLEQGLVSTSYIETTTAPVSAGLLGDMPRLDYSGGATCGSLLLEPSRVNLITQSEYFNASGWNKTRATISDNVAISPEGVQNAAKIVSTAVNDSHYIRRDVSSTTGVCYVFAKADDFTFLKLATNAHGFSPTFFNLVTGEITKSVSYDADIEQLENGWWKCIIKPTDAFTQFFVENAGDSASASHLGDGVKGVFIYGAQVESGSYPTSYIPTYGSASTRGAEIGYTPTGVFGGSNTWTLAFEPSSFDLLGGNNAYVDVYVGGASKITFRAFTNGTDTYLSPYFFDDASYIFGTSGGSKTKCDSGRVILRANGDGTFTLFTKYNGAIQQDTQSASNQVAAQLYFVGNQGRSINQSLIFPTALTDAECIALTTI